MNKFKKHHPKLDTQKIKQLDRIVPAGDFSEVIVNELSDVYTYMKNPRTKISKHLKKYFIIRLVTITEAYLQILIAYLIDKYDLEINHLFQTGEIPIPIKDFKEIRKKEFTKGRVTAISFNFQNLDEVDSVFSRLLGIRFFDIFKEYGLLSIKKGDFQNEDVYHLLDSWNNFREMFALRNEIVHTMITPHKIRKKPNYFEGLWDATYHFLIMVVSVSEDVLSYRRGKLKNKEMCKLFAEKTKEFRIPQN